jgi:hypothetical protein
LRYSINSATEKAPVAAIGRILIAKTAGLKEPKK